MDHSQNFPRQLLHQGTARTKTRTNSGPAPTREPRLLPFPRSARLQLLYHQQTKNILCSYSPKKLGFFL